ncbi:Uncharacterised protein [Vibrio cholerae]|nr:Uncharacterised protein [Vibrio cholerae]CSB18247.1 Uncharacterised protein [Vibrio cholerae]CSI28846.1 Uncharacterised protein [Vibrio cholerae]
MVGKHQFRVDWVVAIAFWPFCGRYRNVNHRVWLWQIVMTNIHRLRRGKHFMGIRSHVRTDHVFAFHRIIRVVTRHLPNHHAA